LTADEADRRVGELEIEDERVGAGSGLTRWLPLTG